jgi:putative hydrolase of the HAD superfamily
MIKTLFFDIGNVLVFFSHSRMCKQVGEICGMSEQAVNELLFEKGWGIFYERGELSSRELEFVFSQHAPVKFSREKFFHALSNIFEPNPDIYPIISQLKEKGYQLVVVSNTCEAHFEHQLKTFEIIKAFDKHILSHQIGSRKPEQQFFDKALTISGSPKEECFYIDDVVEYVEAAKLFGIDAVHYQGVPSLMEQLNQRGIG